MRIVQSLAAWIGVLAFTAGLPVSGAAQAPPSRPDVLAGMTTGFDRCLEAIRTDDDAILGTRSDREIDLLRRDPDRLHVLPRSQVALAIWRQSGRGGQARAIWFCRAWPLEDVDTLLRLDLRRWADELSQTLVAEKSAVEVASTSRTGGPTFYWCEDGVGPISAAFGAQVHDAYVIVSPATIDPPLTCEAE